MKKENIELLKEYFKNTPREQVLKDWESTAYLDNTSSPKIREFFEGGEEEKETSLQIAIKALENIINPIGYMKSKLEEGDTLNGGYAIMMTEKPQFYQNIAEEALIKINSNQ